MAGFGSVTPITVGGSANLPATAELIVDVSAKRYTPYNAALNPLNTILSKLGKEGAKNFRVDVIEAGENPYKFKVATALAAAGTTLSVHDNAEACVAGTVLYNPERDDYASVDTTPTTNDITVTRNVAGATGVAWVAGDIIISLGPLLPENDTTYRPFSVADTNVYNLLQLCKKQFAVTNMMDALPTAYGGPGSKTAALKAEMFRDFIRTAELQTILGGRASSGTAPATVRMGAGLKYFLKSGTLYKNFGGEFTISGLRRFFGDYYDQNPDATDVTLITAGAVVDAIGASAMNNLQLNADSTKYGLNIWSYQIRGRNIKLVVEPLFTDGALRGWGFILDLERIRRKELDPLTYYPWDRNKGQGEIQYHSYREVATLQLANESRHAMFEGALL